MSNYLSHLARASGIAVGRNRPAGPAAPPGPKPRAATPSADAPATGDAGTPEPPHVEYVTFVEQPRGAVRSRGEPDDVGVEAARDAGDVTTDARAGRREEGSAVRPPPREGGARADASPRSADEATRRRVTLEPESPSTVREVRSAPPALDEERVRLVEPDDEATRTTRVERRPERISADAASESTETSLAQTRAHASEETVLVAPRETSPARRAPQTHDDAADAPDPLELRRTYMREVVEWLSAPPPAQTGDDDALHQEERPLARRVERETDEAHAVTAVEIVGGRDAPPARAREVGAERGPEVEDFTLSIGSIQVVIEEPQGRMSAQPAPPQPAPARDVRGRDGGDDIVARLRRHYVRI